MIKRIRKLGSAKSEAQAWQLKCNFFSGQQGGFKRATSERYGYGGDLSTINAVNVPWPARTVYEPSSVERQFGELLIVSSIRVSGLEIDDMRAARSIGPPSGQHDANFLDPS